MSRCMWCAEPIVFQGFWRHQDGALYRQACAECPWQGPEQPGRVCPSCGCPRLRDHHAALPVADEGDRTTLLRAITSPTWDELLKDHERTAYEADSRLFPDVSIADFAKSLERCKAVGIPQELRRDAARRGRDRAEREHWRDEEALAERQAAR